MSTAIRRLMKEAAELSASSASPSPHFCAHPVNDSNLFDWHFTLAGPPSPSPYAGGIYHGRIALPPQYPLRPPSFRFLTPSGRFEVNREICLSISGHHEETWQPAWGIRTALTAIRSFMDGDAKGQLGGLDATDEVRRMWAEKSRSWCCELCSSGCIDGSKKTNEQILTEWRELCRQKGVALDADGKETVPEELRLYYKKQTDKEQTGDGQASHAAGKGGKSDDEQSSSSTPVDPSSSENLVSSEESTIGNPSLSESLTGATQPLPPTPSISPSIPAISQSAQAQSQSISQSTTPSTLPNTATTMTPVTNESSMATPHQGRVQVQSQPSTSDPWLDRAIIVVIIALIIMILRRVSDVNDL